MRQRVMARVRREQRSEDQHLNPSPNALDRYYGVLQPLFCCACSTAALRDRRPDRTAAADPALGRLQADDGDPAQAGPAPRPEAGARCPAGPAEERDDPLPEGRAPAAAG